MIDPYRRWLDEEVGYIITSEEKSAFMKLTTDDEREQFIDQFWQRRNPEPCNPENQFKQEYYRRIIFANEYFSTSIYGWRTDRGRIYIVFGPPERIESNPNGGTIPSFGELAASCADRPKFPGLRAAIATPRLFRRDLNSIPVRAYYIRATEETDVAYFAIQLANRDLQFENKGDVMHAEIDIYGQIESLTGRIVNRFEKAYAIDLREKDNPQAADGTSLLVESVPLHPGRYKLSVALTPIPTGHITTFAMVLAPRPFASYSVTSSSLFLADAAEAGARQEHNTFVIGGDNVSPNPSQIFTRQGELRVYLQVYNLAVDPATHKASLSVQYVVLKNGKPVIEEAGEPSQLSPDGVQVTLDKTVPLKPLEAGQYALQIKITDNIRGQTITPATTFTVR